jgi:predicted porin
MNKKLLAVAMGTALVGSMAVFASAARADVQLYGQIDASIDSHDCGGGAYGGCNGYSRNTGFTSADKSQTVNMNGNYSYFGVKGSEDLGNGLKAIFNVAFAFDVAGRGNGYGGSGRYGIGYGGPGDAFLGRHGSYAGNSMVDSEKWLGVAGDFGTFRAGTVFTPYKEHGEMIDPFYGTSLEGHQGGLQSPTLNSEYFATDYAATGLVNRTMRYDSPDMNGLSGSVFYTMGHGTSTSTLDNNLGNPYGLGGQYKNGNILAFADYQTASVDSAQWGTNFDDKGWDVGGQYTMGNIAMFGRYEGGGLIFANGKSGASLWHLGGSFTMGNTLLYAAYGQGDQDLATTDVGALVESMNKYDAWTLGVKHNLSVRTSVYAGFNQIHQDVVGSSDHFGLGMNVKF